MYIPDLKRLAHDATPDKVWLPLAVPVACHVIAQASNRSAGMQKVSHACVCQVSSKPANIKTEFMSVCGFSLTIVRII